jgi:hypothetical protein
VKRWVCELGGYEHLLYGVDDPVRSRDITVAEMQRWYVRFGIKEHTPVPAGPGLAEQLARFLEWHRVGALAWGHPQRWAGRARWPDDWTLRLEAEAVMRDETGFASLFARPTQNRPTRRRRR